MENLEESDSEFYARLDKEAEEFHARIECYIKHAVDKKMALEEYVKNNLTAFRKRYEISPDVTDEEIVDMAMEACADIL